MILQCAGPIGLAPSAHVRAGRGRDGVVRNWFDTALPVCDGRGRRCLPDRSRKAVNIASFPATILVTTVCRTAGKESGQPKNSKRGRSRTCQSAPLIRTDPSGKERNICLPRRIPLFRECTSQDKVRVPPPNYAAVHSFEKPVPHHRVTSLVIISGAACGGTCSAGNGRPLECPGIPMMYFCSH